jgi:peptidoglycan/LPS O-acetylase OafA/YrhL
MIASHFSVRLSMKPPSSARAPGLDTLRALAILAVMLYHFMPFLPESFMSVTQFGWIGVDLFFVLSGYLIGTQLLKPYLQGETPSIRDFYIRRAFRILPAYLVVLFLYAKVSVWREAPRLAPVWKFLTFTENLRFDPNFRAFSHAWSLCVEEHFYLILPLLVVGMMRRASARKTALLIVAVLLAGVLLRAFALTHLHDDYWPRIYYPTYMRLDDLLVGVTLALVRTFRPVWWSAIAQRGHSATLAGLILIGSVIWMFRNGMGDPTGSSAWGTVIGYPLLALGLGSIVASSVSRNGILSRFPVPGARLLATLAFSLYLTHKAVAHLDQTYFSSITEGQGPQAILLYAVTCTLAAALLYLCVERPFMLIRDRLYEQPRRLVDRQMRSEPAL